MYQISRWAHEGHCIVQCMRGYTGCIAQYVINFPSRDGVSCRGNVSNFKIMHTVTNRSQFLCPKVIDDCHLNAIVAKLEADDVKL